MPPEPLSLDRKDFFKEKKHERSDALGSSLARWRDSHHSSRDFVRWGSDEFRRPLGHGKQGSHQAQLFSPQESSYGCIETRLGDRILDDEGCPPSVLRMEGKYGKDNREDKGYFSPQEWKTGNASVNSLGRLHDFNALRSVDDRQAYLSLGHSNIENLNSLWDHLESRDQHDKITAVNGLGTSLKLDKAQSLGSIAWKPLKWNRTSSLSSRGSGFSHSSSSKSIRADSGEMKSELLLGKRTLQSPSGDGTTGNTSAAPSEDTCPKKQRLGWGQGLAKFEKEKVEGPDEDVSNNTLVLCSNSTKRLHSPFPSISDGSPRVPILSECTSPATPSSVACSSSSGLEEKAYIKVANIDHEASNLSGSPGYGFQNCIDGFSADLELNPIDKFSSLLIDLLQPEDGSSGDSNFLKATATDKLLLIKNVLSKALEKTEFEIDLFENELKSLDFELKDTLLHPMASNSVQTENVSKTCVELDTATKVFSRPAPLQLDSCGDALVGGTLLCSKTPDEIRSEVKVEDIDSPGTATSKFFESSLCPEKAVSSSNTTKHDECSMDYEAARPRTSEEHCFISSTDKNKATEREMHDSIFLSNKDVARKGWDEFKMALQNHQPHMDIWKVCNMLRKRHDLALEGELAKKKFPLRFKERTLILKFKALQHLWKEDLRLLSMRKYRSKSQKRHDLSSRPCHPGNQKQRSSIRARFTSPAGNLTLVPTTELVDFNSRLLSESQIKLYRNILKMPAFILEEKERKLSNFVRSNGLVEDPCALEEERALINIWWPEEKEIFMDMLATFGKDFKKISSFLAQKTTADCVEFYYKNHKSESFDKIKAKLELRKQGRSLPTNTYMVTSAKKWNREMNAASLDMLGTASVTAENANNYLMNQQASSGGTFLKGFCDYNLSRCFNSTQERSNGVDILGNEREAIAADVLAGICGTRSSEAMSSCVTTSFDFGESCQELKCRKVNSLMDRPLTSEVMQNIDDEDTCSDDSYGEVDSIDWTDEEKSIFIQSLGSYGKDFAKISECVGTKSRDQCIIFFSKARKCLGLDVIHPGPDSEGTPVSDASGGHSGTEDACVVETESAICSTHSSSKMDVDRPLSPIPTKIETSGYPGIEHKQNDNFETGLDTIDHGNCHAGVKPESIYDGGNTSVERIEEEPVEKLSSDEGNNQAVNLAEESTFEGEKNEQGQSGELNDVSNEVLKTESVKLEIPVSETKSRISSPQCLGPDLNTKTDAFHLATDTSLHPGFGLITNNPDHISLDPLASIPKSRTISWQQKNSCESASSASSEMSQPASSILNFEEYGGKHLSGHPTLNRGESFQIFKGYPLVSSKNEINGAADSPGNNATLFQTSSRNSQSSQYPSHDIFQGNCNASKSREKLPHPPSNSDTEGKSHTTGNVKLFGKILSDPLSIQKPYPDDRVSDKKRSCTLNGPSVPLKLDLTNHSCLEDFQMKSYGFWDGSKIQTGHLSPPDSAVLLAKYPEAFKDYSAQPLPAVKRNDRNLGRVSVYPTKDVSGNGRLADFQAYRSYDRSKVQPFTVDVTHPIFSELQRQNRFEAVPGFQQQGRGVVRDGGGSAGVSDPVAAIKMHYATTTRKRNHGEGGS